METQETLKRQNILRKKNRARGILLPDFRLYYSIQSYSIQNSLVLTQKQTHRSMKQNRELRNKPTHLQSVNVRQRQEYTVGRRQHHLGGTRKIG